MPIPVTPKPKYPNVPTAPGIPPMQRANSIQATVVGVAQDAQSVLQVLGLLGGPQWGLFTATGYPAFGAASSGIASALTNLLTGSAVSIGDIEYRLDHRIATAPQEQGAFLSYNKVSTPFNGRVTYIVSGQPAQRAAFLAQVASVQADTSLLTLVMPEYSYPSCNVVHNDLRRSAKQGVTMFMVDIWVEEVRVTGTSAFSNTQSPNTAGQVNGGTVQPQAPTPAQKSNIAVDDGTV